MREIGVLEAKTSFSTLIAEIERTGEPVTVTRNGKAAVRIVPLRPSATRAAKDRATVVRELLAARDAMPVLEGFDDLPWESLKRLARNEDRHD